MRKLSTEWMEIEGTVINGRLITECFYEEVTANLHGSTKTQNVRFVTYKCVNCSYEGLTQWIPSTHNRRCASCAWNSKNVKHSNGQKKKRYDEDSMKIFYKEYKTYRNIIYLCSNEKHSGYKYIGGRGITVCERWLDKDRGFQNFLDDMGLSPTPQHRFVRINKEGNYEPTNCEWMKNDA